MLDGQAIVAKARAKAPPAPWRVTRARGWSFITSGAVLLFALYTLINDLGTKAALLHAVEAFVPTLTWNVPTGSGFLLALAVLGAVFAFLVIQYMRKRQQAIIFTPEGFVQGDLRAGKVVRQADYADFTTIALREAPDGAFEPVPHIRLELADARGQTFVWRVDNYFALGPGALVNRVFADFMRRHVKPTPEEISPNELTPQEVVAMVRQGNAPEQWRVFTPSTPVGGYLGLIFVGSMAVLIASVLIDSYFITGPTLPERFNSGRPFGDVLAGELVTFTFLPLIFALLLAFAARMSLMIRMSRTQCILTQTKWVIARKRNGKVVQTLPFNAVSDFRLRYFNKSYTLTYRGPEGKRHTILLSTNGFKSPALVCQTFLARYHRYRAKANLA
jgi:hypothetical protein